MAMMLIACVQRSNAHRGVAARDDLAGHGIMSVADLDRLSTYQHVQLCDAKPRQLQRVVRNVFR